MGFFRRDPEKALEKSHEAMVEKLAEKGNTLASMLQNEIASARTQSTVSNQATYTRAADHYVFEEAVQLESTRPTGRMDRRAVDQDRRGPLGWNNGGIFGARDRNAWGRKPYARWPETSIPPRGTPTQHNYGPPQTHQVIDTRGSGRPGRDGCPGCPYC